MHIANITTASLDDRVEPVDLAQSPGDIVILSFSDSDLNTLAGAHAAAGDLPSLRLAALNDLRHPMSVDLWLDTVAAGAKVILIRLLGGYEWWRYGCEQVAALARRRGIALALLPGECRDRDPDLARLSTVPAAEQAALLACFREGGTANMAVLLARLATLSGGAPVNAPAPKTMPRHGFYQPGIGIVARPEPATPARATVLIVFYRSILLAGDQTPVDALVAALAARDIAGLALFVPSLKDDAATAFLRAAARDHGAAAIVTTTAFAAAQGPAATSVFTDLGVPVLQAMIATTPLAAWRDSPRGLGTADLAMHMVLPELDGRLAAGALSFKAAENRDAARPSARSGADAGPLEFAPLRNRPEASRIDQVVARLVALLDLRDCPAERRRLVIMLPDYPGADGRTGYAVGLDAPASVLAILHDLAAAGYRVDGIPATSRELLSLLADATPAVEGAAWAAAFDRLPGAARDKVTAAWGPPPKGPHRLRHHRFGNVWVVLAPDRGRGADRRADYHDPDLPPRHELLAFGHWLRHDAGAHAVVHVGAHGTLEWLPGKAAALTATCFPEIVAGALPVIYPFIVNNPGEAAQAKRRIAAQTLGHLPPPLVDAGLTAAQAEIERLVDEFVQADGLDRRRRDRLAGLIHRRAAATGLDRVAGVAADADANTALKQIDAWLCDIKDFAIKDGQHIYGRAEAGAPAARRASAAAEKAALLAALDGRFIAPGPAGAPHRGRRDVLPTGRNLYTVDPRALPTATATDLGREAAEEVVRFYLQEHGQWPRALVIDLWGSASLRTGGEEIAQGLWLMGCQPEWDGETGRVTGVQVLPPAHLGRPRIDVTWRISGLFRDMFPAQLALLASAGDAVARRQGEGADNPLAAEAAAGRATRRLFGSAPGTYGSGAEALLQSGAWRDRAAIGAAYLATADHAFDEGGDDGAGRHDPDGFSAQVARADLLVHIGDDAGRDLLEGSADAAFIGGFAAAAARLGKAADLVTLDTRDPHRPRARALIDDLRRVVTGRAVNPRYIAGQMRHGPRGAADFAETVDRLVAFAETTESVPSALIDMVHDAYVGDARVRDFIRAENPAAGQAMANRLRVARRRGLWHPRRNQVDDELAALAAPLAGDAP